MELFRIALESPASPDIVGIASAVASLAGSIIVAVVTLRTSKMSLDAANAALQEARRTNTMEAARRRLGEIELALADVATKSVSLTDTAGRQDLDQALAILRLRLDPSDAEHRPIVEQLDRLSGSIDRQAWSRQLLAIAAASIRKIERQIV